MVQARAECVKSAAGRFRRFPPGLELNAIALMASTGITALFGLAFWTVAARMPAAEVGRSSAVISTATMLSRIASANVGLLFGRVLASAGPRSRAVVLAGYGAAMAVGLAIGAGFVLVVPNEPLFGSDLERVAFPLLVILFCLFALQDWVLIGVRAAGWVPVEQLLFAAGKLALLALFSAAAIENSILLAWGIPCLIAVLVINAVLLLRGLKGRVAAAEAVAMPARRELTGIFFAEYATGMVTVVIPLALPLLVVWRLGTEANAYYALPWLIAESLSLLMWNISSSFVVEASHNSKQTAALMRRTFRLSFLVCVLGVPFLLVAAPWLLTFLGPNYAAHGTTVLRLMVLAVPFAVITTMYINTSRVKNRMGHVLAVEAALAIMVVGLTMVLLDPLGIDGAGWAYLSAQVLTAAVVIVPLVRGMRASLSHPRPSAAPALSGPAGRQPPED